LEAALQEGVDDSYRLQQVIRRQLGKWVSDTHRRRPMIIPVVIQAWVCVPWARRRVRDTTLCPELVEGHRAWTLSSAIDLASLDARGADVQPLRCARHHRVHPLNIGVPAPIGLLLWPGDVVAESGPFAANVTYCSHWNPLPNTSIQRKCPKLGNRKRVPD